MCTEELVCPGETPGVCGVQDQADPDALVCIAETPGPAGVADEGAAAATPWCGPTQPLASIEPEHASHPSADEPVTGSVLVGAGAVSAVRIPVPNSGGLFVELKPRGWVPKGGTTSTLFIQSTDGKRHLRLDYGYNKATGGVDYHWNQKSVAKQFGITNHQAAGAGGRELYRGAKYLKWGGRALIVVGLAADAYSIVQAKNKTRQVTRVVAGWAGAWAGCKIVGAGGAYIGSVVPGKGTAIGGLVGCIAGGAGGALGASWAAGETYDWVEETFYEPLPEAPAQ